MKWPDPKNLICPLCKAPLVIKLPFNDSDDYIYKCKRCIFNIRHSILRSIMNGETQLSAPKINK